MNNIKISYLRNGVLISHAGQVSVRGNKTKTGEGTCERVNIESLADKLKLLRPSKEGQLHKGFS